MAILTSVEHVFVNDVVILNYANVGMVLARETKFFQKVCQLYSLCNHC